MEDRKQVCVGCVWKKRKCEKNSQFDEVLDKEPLNGAFGTTEHHEPPKINIKLFQFRVLNY